MIGFALGVASSLVATLLWSELDAWGPKISRVLLSRAVANLPAGKRDRFHEEWAAHLGDMPTSFSQLIAAFGFIVAAERIRVPDRVRLKYAIDKVEAALLLFVLAPALVVIAISTAIAFRQLPLLRLPCRSGGKTIGIYHFRIVRDGAKADKKLSPFGQMMVITDFYRLPNLFNVLLGDVTIVGPPPLCVRSAAEAARLGMPVEDERLRAGLTFEGRGRLVASTAHDFAEGVRSNNARYEKYLAEWTWRAELALLLGRVRRGMMLLLRW